MAQPRVAVVVGSLRKDSYNRKMAQALVELAHGRLDMEIVEIRDLPLYDQDYDDGHQVPAAYTAFRDRVRPFDGVMFVTPEYNRSMSGALKNAIDVGSRPYGKSVWSGKPCAVVTVSPGALGGFGANHHVRQCLVFLDMPVLQQPEMYMNHAAKLFGPDGTLVDEGARKLAQTFVERFAAWVTQHAPLQKQP